MIERFGEEHAAFRRTVRTFAEKELAPHADEWERDEMFPNWVFARAGELGIHGAHYPEEHGGGGGDYWFSVAKAEEYWRISSAGVGMGLLVQSDMATPCISDLGTREQIDEFLRPALRGERIAALGVSEPGAGSDVAGIQTTARKVGGDYIVRGAKTYITNGTRASFITLLVKTNPEAGYGGISILLFPTDTKGFQVAKKLSKIGNHARTPPSSRSTTARCRPATSSARRARASTTSCRTSRPSGWSRRSRRGRKPGGARSHGAVRARPGRVRQAAHQARGVAAPPGRPPHRAGGGPPAHLPRGRLLQRRALRAARRPAQLRHREEDLDGQAVRRRGGRQGGRRVPPAPRRHGLHGGDLHRRGRGATSACSASAAAPAR